MTTRTPAEQALAHVSAALDVDGLDREPWTDHLAQAHAALSAEVSEEER